MSNPKFKVDDRVYYPARDLHGTVVKVFWADAGDPKHEGYQPWDEHYRYYIATKRGMYSVKESQLVISHSKFSTISSSEISKIAQETPDEAS